MMKNPPHPGELLREEVLVPLGLAVIEAAARLSMSRVALSRVLNGHAGISPDLAIRLERAGASSARFWVTLQANYDLAKAHENRNSEGGFPRGGDAPNLGGIRCTMDTD